MTFSELRKTAAAATFALAAAGLAVVPMTAEVVHAQGNSGGKGGGASGASNGGGGADSGEGRGGEDRASPAPGKPAERGAGGASQGGALASELGALNAAHASPQALANAAPGSMPGKLAAYRDGHLEALDAAATLQGALDAYQACLDSGADADCAEAEQAVTDAQAAYDAVIAVYSDAYYDLTGGVLLSDAALAELNAMLGL